MNIQKVSSTAEQSVVQLTLIFSVPPMVNARENVNARVKYQGDIFFILSSAKKNNYDFKSTPEGRWTESWIQNKNKNHTRGNFFEKM